MSASLQVPGQGDPTRSPAWLPTPSSRHHQHAVSAFSFSSEEDDDMPLDDELDSDMDPTYRYSITAALAAATQDSLNDSPSVPGEDLPIRRTSCIHLSNSNHQPFRLQSPKKRWQRHQDSDQSINSTSFLHLEQDNEYESRSSSNPNGHPSEPLSPCSQPKSDPLSATISEIPKPAPRYVFPAPPGFHKPIFSPLTDNQWFDSLHPSPGPYFEESPWNGATFDDDYDSSPRNSRFPTRGRPSSLTLGGSQPNSIFAALGNPETVPEPVMDEPSATRCLPLTVSGAARPATIYHTPPQSNSQSNSKGNSHQGSPRSQTPVPNSHGMRPTSSPRAETESVSNAADTPPSPASTASPTETKANQTATLQGHSAGDSANETDGEDRAATPTPARRRRCASLLSPAQRARVGISVHKGEGLLEWARPLLEMDPNGMDRRASVGKMTAPSARTQEVSKRPKRASAFV